MTTQLVRYTLCDIDLMMVDIEGTLYCSTPQLERVFGLDHSNLSRMVATYPQEFSRSTCALLTGSVVPPKEIRDGLMLQRLRKNTRLWSEDDLIGITWLVRSDIARKCRTQFKEILKQHACREMVPREQLDKMMMTCSTLTEQVGHLWQAVEDLKEANSQMASNAGRSLRLVKG